MGKQKKISGRETAGGARRARRAAAAVIPLIFLSFFLAALTVSAANDIYAFVKPDTEAEIHIDGNTSLLSVSKILENEGIINNPTIFALYVRAKGAEDRIVGFSGDVRLGASMSYREIIAAFSKNTNNS